MKKSKLIIFIMILFLGMFFFMPMRVSAYTYNPDKNGQDFTPYKNDIYYCELEQYDITVLEDGTVLVIIRQGFNNGLAAQFQFHKDTDFSSVFLPYLFPPGAATRLRDVFGVDKIYWNPWQQLWQLEYPVDPEEEVNGTAGDWFEHISQFDGVASCVVFHSGESGDENFIISIVEEPSGEFDGCNFVYDGGLYSEDWIYFEPRLQSVLKDWAADMFYWDLASLLEDEFGEDYKGYLYWNFENHYWQINYYNKSEFNNKEVDMVTDLLDTLAEIGAGIGDLFGKIVESVGQFFYVPGTGDTPGQFTIIGILTIAAVVVSLSMWVLRLILRLFKLRG